MNKYVENLNEANELYQQETLIKSYECYYCDKYVPTNNRDDYEKHVVLSHDGTDPSKYELKKRIKTTKKESGKLTINKQQNSLLLIMDKKKNIH